MIKRRSSATLSFVVALLGTACSDSAHQPAVDPVYRSFTELLAGTATGQLRMLDQGDIDGDGFPDVVIGGQSFAPPGNPGDEFQPVLLFRNEGGDNFSDASSRLVGTPPALADAGGDPEGFSPLARFADFNGDGKKDLVVFFWGYETRALDNAYLGRPPLLYLSQPGASTDLVYSGTLGAAVKALRESIVVPPGPCNVSYETGWGCDVFAVSDDAINSLGIDGSELHVKAFDVGDVDGDGDRDITVETGGGFGTSFYLVVFVNDGAGNFSAAADRFPVTALKGPPTAGSGLSCSSPNASHGTWRHYAHRLVDMNGDGALDMVMTGLRNVRSDFNCDHVNLRSKIFLNNGSGTFSTAPTELPNPPIYEPGAAASEASRTFNGQAIAYGDILGDARPELVIVYTRSTDADALESTDWASTGRYVQILEGTVGNWADVSEEYLGSQATTLLSEYTRVMHPDPTLAAMLTRNNGDVKRVELVDMNDDGRTDIVVSGNAAVISEFAPLLYLNEGDRFRAFNPAAIVDHPFAYVTGLMAIPFDVDGDGKRDWLFSGPLNGLSSAGSLGAFFAQ